MSVNSPHVYIQGLALLVKCYRLSFAKVAIFLEKTYLQLVQRYLETRELLFPEVSVSLFDL